VESPPRKLKGDFFPKRRKRLEKRLNVIEKPNGKPKAKGFGALTPKKGNPQREPFFKKGKWKTNELGRKTHCMRIKRENNPGNLL